MKNDIIKQFNLPKYVKGKSFAEASKAIEKKFEDRNDKYAIETKEELLGRLAEAQESVKPPMPDTNQHMLGAMVGAANAAGAAGSGLAGIMGAAAPALGPLGIAASLAPLAINALSSPSKQEVHDDQINQLQGAYADMRSDFAYGGNTNQYLPGGLLAALPSVLGAIPSGQGSDSGSGAGNFLSGLYGDLFGTKEKTNNTIGGALRFSPIISNMIQKGQIQKPMTPRGTRVGTTYDEQPVDTNLMVNQINQNNVNRALSESSGGDLGALRSNILSANLNKNKAVSDATIQADQINRQDRQFGFSNRLRKDTFNAQLDDRYLDRRAQDLGAYNSAKSQFASAIGNDLGAIGKEMQQKELMKQMFGYDWMGNFLKPNSSMYGGYKKRK